jgi:fructokinase
MRPSTPARRAGAGGGDASRPGCRGPASAIAGRAGTGDAAARATLDRHASRLARGLAGVINVVDPEVIVLGGGLSKLAHLYTALPALVAPHVFAEQAQVTVRPPRWGDASGVRGAARLWEGEDLSRQ